MGLSDLFIFALGFLAQALFGSRMILQWIQSEKAGKVTSPALFWEASLIASFLFLVYGILRSDLVIVVGQVFSYFIYIRNLQLKQLWKKLPGFFRLIVLVLPFASIIWALTYSEVIWSDLFPVEGEYDFLIWFGFAGQLFMNLRFLYQWYYSEKIGDSILPTGFWSISVIGSLLLISYAVYRLDPVLFAAQALGFVIYVRNLILGQKANSVI